MYVDPGIDLCARDESYFIPGLDRHLARSTFDKRPVDPIFSLRRMLDARFDCLFILANGGAGALGRCFHLNRLWNKIS